MNIFGGGGGGYEEIVDIFLGPLQIELFWGHFYTFKFFLKIKVQNGNILGGSQNFKCGGYARYSFILICRGGGGGVKQKMLGPSLGVKKK